MVRKLFVYDFKSLWQPVMYGYIALIFVGILTNIWFNAFDAPEENFTLILSLVLGALIIGVNIAVIVNFIHWFYESCYGKQGYLTFTLPMTVRQILVSKVLSTLAVIGTTVLAYAFMLAVMFPVSYWVTFFSDRIWLELWAYVLESGIGTFTSYVIIVLLLGIFGFMTTVSFIYLSISIGQLFNSYRIPIAFVSFFILSTAESWIFTKLTLYYGQKYEYIYYGLRTLSSINSQFLTYVLLLVLMTGLALTGTWWIMKNRLNLE